MTENIPDVLLHEHITYAFTLNPDDKRQFFTAPQKNLSQSAERLKTFTHKWHAILTEMFSMNETDFHLNIECSEPIKDSNDRPPRLHFHGYIRFNSVFAIREFLLINARVLKTMSNFTIKEIDDPDKWMDYIHKQTFLMLGEINNMPPNEQHYLQWIAGYIHFEDEDESEDDTDSLIEPI